MKKCILVFDDEQEILEVCRIILERQNYLVETRLVCQDIIEDISEAKPDIILMDLWIPNMGGEKAVELIKSDALTRHIPVILFSANAEIEKISERTNADGFLKKPFEIPSLLAIINKNI
jgi:CheY-like chemotaxis protein